jgi:hypothetical protein
MLAAHVLLAAGAAIPGLFGCIHLFYTYHGNKLHPRDAALREAMERSSPVITRQTTMWRAATGFHASHSLGMVSFALTYAYLALWRPEVLLSSPYLMALGMAVQLAYLVLAKRYFFRTPFRGAALACLLYAAGWALMSVA